MDHPTDPSELRERQARYDEAGLLGKAALRLSREALTAAERARLRRADLGPCGRVAEDVVRVVVACGPIWDLLATKGLPEDLSVSELNAIWECLLGREPRGWGEANVLDVSIKFTGSPLHIAALRRVIPGTTPQDAFDAYRYATLRTVDTHDIEPFLVALRERKGRDDDIVATMLVAPTFLRHEEELGVFDAEDLGPVEDVLVQDLAAVADTRAQLSAAPEMG